MKHVSFWSTLKHHRDETLECRARVSLAVVVVSRAREFYGARMKDRPTVRTELIIPASRRAVWDVLVDFARYPEWNPFTIGVGTTGRIGDPVKLDVMLGGKRMKMSERMRVYEAQHRVGWGLKILGGVLLDCTRIQELEDVGEGSTRYVCYESFRGLAVPLFFGRYRAPMQEGFEANAQALSRRVLSLATQAGTTSLGSTES
jgi:hypothetical protein